MAPRIGIGIGVGRRRAAGFSAEFQTVYDSWTNKPSSSVANKYDAMVRIWVATGYWDEPDVIYVLGGHTNDDGEALTNWKNPGTYDAAIVLNGGTMNFVAFEGFSSSDNAYIDTGWDPTNAANNFKSTLAHTAAYINTDVADWGYDYGINTVNDITLISRAPDDKAYAALNGGSRNYVNSNAKGMHTSTRNGTTLKMYLDKTEKFSEAVGGDFPTSSNMFLLCVNDGAGNPGSYNPRQQSFFSGGGYLTPTEVDGLNDGWAGFFFSINKSGFLQTKHYDYILTKSGNKIETK